MNNKKINNLKNSSIYNASEKENKNKKRKLLNTRKEEKKETKRIRYSSEKDLNSKSINLFEFEEKNHSTENNNTDFFQLLPLEMREFIYLKLLLIFNSTAKSPIALANFALSCKTAFNEVNNFITLFLQVNSCKGTKCSMNLHARMLSKEIYLERNMAFNTLRLLKKLYFEQNKANIEKIELWHKHLILTSFIDSQKSAAQMKTNFPQLRALKEQLNFIDSLLSGGKSRPNSAYTITFHKSLKSFLKLTKAFLESDLKCFNETGTDLLDKVLEDGDLLDNLFEEESTNLISSLRRPIKRANLNILLELFLLTLSSKNEIQKELHFPIVELLMEIYAEIENDQHEVYLKNAVSKFTNKQISQILSSILDTKLLSEIGIIGNQGDNQIEDYEVTAFLTIIKGILLFNHVPNEINTHYRDIEAMEKETRLSKVIYHTSKNTLENLVNILLLYNLEHQEDPLFTALTSEGMHKKLEVEEAYEPSDYSDYSDYSELESEEESDSKEYSELLIDFDI